MSHNKLTTSPSRCSRRNWHTPGLAGLKQTVHHFCATTKTVRMTIPNASHHDVRRTATLVHTRTRRVAYTTLLIVVLIVRLQEHVHTSTGHRFVLHCPQFQAKNMDGWTEAAIDAPARPSYTYRAGIFTRTAAAVHSDELKVERSPSIGSPAHAYRWLRHS